MDPGERLRRTSLLSCIAACVAAVFLLLGAIGLKGLSGSQEHILSIIERGPAASHTLENSWTSAGQSYRVAVTSEPGESIEQLVVRFEGDLVTMKSIHPEQPR